MKYQNILSRLTKSTVVHVLLLLLAVFLSYHNILQNGFAYDDKDFLLNWPVIRDWKNLGILLQGELPEVHQGVYRPIRGPMFLAFYSLYQTNPFWYHLQSIFIQIFNVLLIYLIIKKIIKKPIVALMSALLFATHPIHTENIAFITCSIDSIGIIFFFFSFYLYLKAEERQIWKKFLYLGSLAYAFLGFFTYEVTLTLPFLIVLYDLTFNKLTKATFFKRIKIYSLYFAVLLLYPLIRFLVYNISDRASYLGPQLLSSAKNARVEVLEILWQYIKLLVWPQNLIAKYPIPHQFLDWLMSVTKSGPDSILVKFLSTIDIIIPPLTILLIVGIIIKLFRRSSIIAFSVSWFFIALLPVLSITPQGAVIGERYLYIPSFGFALLSGYLFYKLYVFFKIRPSLIHFSKLIILLFIMTVSWYSYSTYKRNLDWKDSETLFAKAVQLDSKSSFLKATLGLAQADAGKLDLAISTLKDAIELDPRDIRAYFNLAILYDKKNDPQSALKTYQKIIEINPNFPPAYINSGYLYQQLDQLEKSIEQYQKALLIDPKDPYAHYHLALVYDKKGNLDSALNEYQETVALIPYSQAYNNMGIIYAKQGNLTKAIRAFQISLDIDPNNAKTYFNLGQVYETAGDTDKAISQYEEGLKINPDESSVKEKVERLKR